MIYFELVLNIKRSSNRSSPKPFLENHSILAKINVLKELALKQLNVSSKKQTKSSTLYDLSYNISRKFAKLKSKLVNIFYFYSILLFYFNISHKVKIPKISPVCTGSVGAVKNSNTAKGKIKEEKNVFAKTVP